MRAFRRRAASPSASRCARVGRERFHVHYEPENRIVEVGPRRGSLLALMPALLQRPAGALVGWLDRLVVAEREVV